VRATQLVEQHLQLFCDDVEGLDRYAECLMAAGDYRKAVGVLRSVLTLGGPSATLLSRLGQSLVALGEFEQGMACHRQAVTRGAKAAVLWAAMVRDWSYCPWGETEASRQAAAGLGAAVAAAGPKVARKSPVAQVKPVLTVGFLCNAPRDEDHRAMVAAVAGGLKGATVKVVGFGPGELGEASNVAYRGAFDVWRNTLKVDELTVSALVRGEGVDVLIDSDGLAARERLSLMTRNPAPLQVSWLNVPVGVSIPGAHLHMGDEAGPSCGMLLLPCAAANPTPLPASRPDAGITFGADVTRAELTPDVVRVWAAILHAVPNASLVLANRSFDEPEAADRLVEMFGNFGVAHRIEIAEGANSEEFFTEVDVALAPFPVVRPAPYGLALSSGVPVVALARGESAVFAKSLRVLGGAVENLVVATEDEYVAAAVAASADLGALAEFRKSMPLTLRQGIVFSPAAFGAEWARFFRDKLAVLAAVEA
jgi:predicted O-linked N-acetylglucosamine transferase (SPINDLY family)